MTDCMSLTLQYPKCLFNGINRRSYGMFHERNSRAIILTSHSTANFIKHLLNNGLQFVLTRRFSTDNIERFHGAVRNHWGNNDHPAVGHCLSAIERISRTQLAMTPMHCNTPLVTEAVLKKGDSLIVKDRKSKCTKLRAKDVLRQTEINNINLLKTLEYPPGNMVI